MTRITPKRFDPETLADERAHDRQGTYPGSDLYRLHDSPESLQEVDIPMMDRHAREIFVIKDLAKSLTTTGNDGLAKTLMRLAPTVLSPSELDATPFDPGMKRLYAVELLKFVGDLRGAFSVAEDATGLALGQALMSFHGGKSDGVSVYDHSGIEAWASGVMDDSYRNVVKPSLKAANIRKYNPGTPGLLIIRGAARRDYTLRIVNLDKHPPEYGKTATIDQLSE